jgi:hypothetical protein
MTFCDYLQGNDLRFLFVCFVLVSCFCFVSFCFETESHCVGQTGHKLIILPPQPPEYCVYRCVSPLLVTYEVGFLGFFSPFNLPWRIR